MDNANESLLTKEEMATIRSMGLYWREVIERDDKSPLKHELEMITKTFGTRLLFILLQYTEKYKERLEVENDE